MGKEKTTMVEDFTTDQVQVLVLLERIGGSISLVAVAFIFVAYSFVPRVRNVQNTFIVFASVSNVGASIASIIAFDGLEAGKHSSICQAQSFLFEMFMQSDPWWSMAMAVNVLLVFYFRATPESFRRWWWLYCLVCYGGPFIIALSLLLVKTKERGSVYGEATIWCWVDRRWDDIRIYTYYMLIWVCIVGSLLCYALVGYHVFRSRDKLRSLTASKSGDAGYGDVARVETNEAYYGTVVTEVQVTSSAATQEMPAERAAATQEVPAVNTKMPRSNPFELPAMHAHPTSSQYYSSVSSPSRVKHTTPPSPLSRVASATVAAAKRFIVADPIKRAYLRTSFLFALSVLVTWIPSSLNRIHSWVDGQSPYEYHVATAAVLPLQGLWNAVIFFVTSWNVIQRHRRTTTALAAADAANRSALDSGRATIGGTGGREAVCCRSDTDLDDGDSRTMGSEIELQHFARSQGDSTPPVSQ